MELTDVVGDFGPWQRTILITVILRGVVTGLIILCTVVLVPPLKFHCASAYFQFDQQNATDHQQCSFTNGNQTLVCDRWDYESADSKTTLNMEFDLVCDRKWMAAWVHVSYFIGSCIGFIPSGYLADRYGRKPIALIGALVTLLTVTTSIFSPTYYFFLLMRLASGFGAALFQNSTLLLYTETVGPRYRDYFIWSFMGGFGIGQILIGLSYWAFGHWKHILIMTGAIIVLLILMIWILVPESARWLLTVNRDARAGKVIENAARKNNRVLVNKEIVFEELKKKIEDVVAYNKNERKETSVIDILRDKSLRKITVLFYITLMNINFLYYFFQLNAGKFGTTLHLTVILLGVFEVLSTFVYLLMAKFLSRKWSIFVNYVIGGVIFLAVVAIPTDEIGVWISLTLTMIGKVAVSVNFGFVWVVGAELLPTTVRSSGLDLGWALGRISSTIAPFFVELWNLTGSSPLIFVGIYSLFAGVVVFFLPETKDQNLTDTIGEAKKHFFLRTDSLTTKRGSHAQKNRTETKV